MLADVFNESELDQIKSLFDKWARRVTVPMALVGLVRGALDDEAPKLITRFGQLYIDYPGVLITLAEERINNFDRRKTRLQKDKKRKWRSQPEDDL